MRNEEYLYVISYFFGQESVIFSSAYVISYKFRGYFSSRDKFNLLATHCAIRNLPLVSMPKLCQNKNLQGLKTFSLQLLSALPKNSIGGLREGSHRDPLAVLWKERCNRVIQHVVP